jgi:hypothetical protein
MKIKAFWDVALCSLGVKQQLPPLSQQWMLMEAVHPSETSVYSNKTTWRYIPEGSNLHTHWSENLKSHI